MNALIESGMELRRDDIELGRKLERERIVELAWDWISEMRGHDGDCSCRHEATILQQFIEHVDFKGEQK